MLALDAVHVMKCVPQSASTNLKVVKYKLMKIIEMTVSGAEHARHNALKRQ